MLKIPHLVRTVYSLLERSLFGCLHISKYLDKNGKTVRRVAFYAEGSNHPDVSKYPLLHCYLDNRFWKMEMFIFNAVHCFGHTQLCQLVLPTSKYPVSVTSQMQLVLTKQNQTKLKKKKGKKIMKISGS